MLYTFTSTTSDFTEELAKISYENDDEKDTIESYICSSPVSISLLLGCIKTDLEYDVISCEQFVNICENILAEVLCFIQEQAHEELDKE